MGNKEMDQAAEEAINDGIEYNCLPLYSEVLGNIKEMCRKDWQEYFDERSPSKGIWYKTIQFELPRYVVALCRLHSGYTPGNKLKRLMGISEAPNCSVCGTVEDVYHMLTECVRNVTKRRALQCSVVVGNCNSILGLRFSSDKAEILAKLNCIFMRGD